MRILVVDQPDFSPDDLAQARIFQFLDSPDRWLVLTDGRVLYRRRSGDPLRLAMTGLVPLETLESSPSWTEVTDQEEPAGP